MVVLQPDEILIPWCPRQREPFHCFPWILKEALIILPRHSVLCCDPKPMWISGQRRLCVWVSDLCSACFCCSQNMGLLQDELWFQEITHIVSKFACPSLTLWTAHFSCFRNILMLDFDILLPHGHITINFPLHTDRLEDS